MRGIELTDLALAGAAIVLGFASVLWLGAALACILTRRPIPAGGPLSALRALAHVRNPSSAWPDPSQLPGPVPYWTASGLVLALLLSATIGVGILVVRGRDRRPANPQLLRNLPGMARAGEVAAVAGRRALLRRSATTRPSTGARPAPEEIGYRIGAIGGRDLWCSVEDSALLVGPPRMGKGLHVVIPWVLDAPGPVLATSTRPDTLTVTSRSRAARGPVAVFDPQRLAGLPDGLAWSPVRGCQTPRTALVRARGLAAGVGFGHTVSDGDFWAGQTETALRCLLHAAALDSRRTIDLYRWSLNPVLAEDAVTVLTRSPGAAEGWADALDAVIHTDPRTRDSVWLGVRQSLSALADPDVLVSVDPAPGHEFDPAAFLRGCGTLYLLASAVASGSCAPLVAAFVEDITETARTLAARSPGARLDPPLLLALDEIANLTPLPSLPQLLAEGGGSGITTLAVLQSLAQARDRWGEHAADTLWDAATVKLVLGGLGKYRDLDDVARLIGEIDELTETRTRARAGDRSSSSSIRTVPVLPASALRTLPFGTGVLLVRQARPAVVDLRPWTARPDARRLRADQAAVEQVSGHAPGRPG
ncbi:MAG TPA: TraM recognition domain-containing protein [Propionicimonas sp.]|jgi:type IV secretory pathway TraG/TraD family ATPase VirD4